IFSTLSKEDLSFSLTESTRDVLIPASLSYFQRNITDDPTHVLKWQETRLSLADFVVDKLSFGITGILSSVKINEVNYNQTNGHLGFFYTPTDMLGLGLVFYNVFGVNELVPEEVRFQPKIGAGVNYIYRGFVRYRFDVISADKDSFG